MSFQPLKLFIFITVVSSITLAQPICKRLLGKHFIPLLQIRDEVIAKTADPGVYLVKAQDFLFHFETVTTELKNTSTTELMARFEELVQIEQNDHGGLTGIRHRKFTALELISDLAQRSEPSRGDYNDFSDATFEIVKQEHAKSPPTSQRLFSNYFRNELSSLQAFGVYPTFFVQRIVIDSKTPSIKLKMNSNNMSPTSDFRIYTSLLQREIMRRLIENPKKVFAEMGLEYPKDDKILKDSLEDLESLIYYSR